MPKTIYVSREGYASCPACLNHVRVDVEADETVCPFCDEQLAVAARNNSTSEGSGALEALKSSRTGAVASALAGAGLSLTVACVDPEPGDEEPDAGWNVGEDAGDDSDDSGVNFQEEDTNGGVVADYGDFPEENRGMNDPGGDAGMEDAGDNEEEANDEEANEEEANDEEDSDD